MSKENYARQWYQSVELSAKITDPCLYVWIWNVFFCLDPSYSKQVESNGMLQIQGTCEIKKVIHLKWCFFYCGMYAKIMIFLCTISCLWKWSIMIIVFWFIWFPRWYLRNWRTMEHCQKGYRKFWAIYGAAENLLLRLQVRSSKYNVGQ